MIMCRSAFYLTNDKRGSKKSNGSQYRDIYDRDEATDNDGATGHFYETELHF